MCLRGIIFEEGYLERKRETGYERVPVTPDAQIKTTPDVGGGSKRCEGDEEKRRQREQESIQQARPIVFHFQIGFEHDRAFHTPFPPSVGVYSKRGRRPRSHLTPLHT